MEVKNGQDVSVHYKGTLADGTEFDNSYSRNQTLDFQVGSDKLIKGFSTAVVGMKVGEIKNVTLGPDAAYGPTRPEAFISVPKAQFPDEFDFVVGQVVSGKNPDGSTSNATIESQDTFTVTLNCNHPLAGKDISFEIEMVSINAD